MLILGKVGFVVQKSIDNLKFDFLPEEFFNCERISVTARKENIKKKLKVWNLQETT